MLIVGLTGGIGSGKSTVADFFAELGVPIIDTDVIARTVVAPGTKALDQIVAQLGSSLLNDDGSLNRANLRELIFDAPEKRTWLESLLHPLIRAETQRQVTQVADAPYAIVVIPLLTETWPHPLIERVLVVDCPESAQLERAQARDQDSAERITKIIQQQASRTERLALADDVITNDQDLDHLRQQTKNMHEKYLDITK